MSHFFQKSFFNSFLSKEINELQLKISKLKDALLADKDINEILQVKMQFGKTYQSTLASLQAAEKEFNKKKKGLKELASLTDNQRNRVIDELLSMYIDLSKSVNELDDRSTSSLTNELPIKQYFHMRHQDLGYKFGEMQNVHLETALQKEKITDLRLIKALKEHIASLELLQEDRDFLAFNMP